MDGIILLDKPAGITSAKAVSIIKKKYNFKKVGHAGTLDPMATGLLIILCGKATKLQSVFFNYKKNYQGVIRLGISTDTDDVSGTVVEEDNLKTYLQNNLALLEQKIVEEFTGRQQQIPPAYSAVKINGVRSYKLARKGKQVELKEKEIVIEKLAIKFISQIQLSYDVICSKGTYVRSLARDIGNCLGTKGCLETIRRLSCGPFNVTAAVSLSELELNAQVGNYFIPVDTVNNSLAIEPNTNGVHGA